MNWFSLQPWSGAGAGESLRCSPAPGALQGEHRRVTVYSVLGWAVGCAAARSQADPRCVPRKDWRSRGREAVGQERLGGKGIEVTVTHVWKPSQNEEAESSYINYMFFVFFLSGMSGSFPEIVTRSSLIQKLALMYSWVCGIWEYLVFGRPGNKGHKQFTTTYSFIRAFICVTD